MTTARRENGYVQWKVLLPLSIGVLTVLGTFGSVLHYQHLQHVHAGAMTIERFDQLQNRHDLEHQAIQRQLDKIESKVDRLLARTK